MRAVRFAAYMPAPTPEQRARQPLVVSSFKETATIDMERERQPAWLAHNEAHLSRVYPKGSRVDSSNIQDLHACRLWAAGVQLVALNVQTWDSAMMLDEALFQLNGGCGYVLKPQLPPRGETLSCGVLLTLRVICASNLPKTRDERLVARPWDEWHPQGAFAPQPLQPANIISPSCEVELIGGLVGSEDAEMLEERWSRCTSTVANNGLNPSWAEEEFRCACYTPDSSFLKLSVYNARHQLMGKPGRQLLAYEAALVGALRPGYRSVQMRCPNGGSPIESCSLLVHIELTPLEPNQTQHVIPATPPQQSADPLADAPPPVPGSLGRAAGRRLSLRTRTRSRCPPTAESTSGSSSSVLAPPERSLAKPRSRSRAGSSGSERAAAAAGPPRAVTPPPRAVTPEPEQPPPEAEPDGAGPHPVRATL